MAPAPNHRIFSARPRPVAMRAVLVITLLLLLPARAPAQRYHTHIYTEGDGLSSGAVYDITQGTDGTMWFATRFGVSSYDGAHWTTYDLRDGLPNIDQRRILCDAEGRMWTIAPNYAVAVFDNGAWIQLPVLEAQAFDFFPPAAVAPSDSGTVLVLATYGDGTHYYRGSSWQRAGMPGDPDRRIRDIVLHNHRMYLASADGVLVLDPGNIERGAAYAAAIPRRKALALASDPATGTLWVAADDHIARVRGGSYETVAEDVSFETGALIDYLTCEPDRFGGLYVGNPVALYRYDSEGVEHIGLSSGLSGVGAASLFLDREGNMWAGTLRGITKIPSLRFANYTAEHGLQNNEVTAVVERGEGDVVLGHPAGFTFFGEERGTISLPPHAESRVLDMTLDRDGYVWAAVNTFGLARIDPRNRLEWVPLDGEHDTEITSVRVDRNDRVWVTTMTHTFVEADGGFIVRDAGVFLEGETSYLRRIFETAGGTVYIASNKGLFRIRPGGYDHFTTPAPVRANQVYALHEDENGRLWLGTMAGLCTVENGEITVVTDPALRIDRPVYFIVEDGRGRLWFGSDNGVYRRGGSSMELFTIEDGLVGRETNRAAGVLDSRGRLWIGMDRGVSVYRPRFDVPGRVAPLVSLDHVDVNGRILPLDEPLKLGPADNTLVFRFAAKSFINEKHVRFAAWLEGFDESWLENLDAPNREIRYTNLSPGDYRFHLRASSAEGAWSEPVSSAPITIDAPFWQRPPFVAAVFVALALAVFVGVGFVSQRRYARRLEDEVRERLDELRMVEAELHKAQRIETLGLLAGGIAHDFNNLLTIMMGNLSFIADNPRMGDNEQKHARDALAAALRARALTQQLLTFSRGGAPSRKPASIAAVIRETASFTMSGASAGHTTELPDDLQIVDIDPGQMSQVINNLLINAREAMPDGGEIRIAARNHPRSPRPELKPGAYVEVEISDTGTGIDPEHLDRIFDPYFSTREGHTGMGLATSYSIVKRHDGLLTVDSRPGQGTTCRIYVPASKDQTEAVPVETTRTGARRGRILVMDDERAILNLMGKALEREGHAVELARDGAEAVSLYSQHMNEGRAFDVVIMDLTVPGGMGGKEAMKMLKKMDPNVRAIVASGYSNDPVIANYRKYGFYGCIRKPFTADDLLRAVDAALSGPPDD